VSDKTRLVKNSLILYFRLIVVSAVGLLSARFILHGLGVSDFGLYNVVGGIVVMMAFLNNVMVATSFRYIAYELGTGKEEGVNRVYNISLVIQILLALLVIFLGETAGVFYIRHYLNFAVGKLDDALFVFRLSILSTVISIISVPNQGLITAKEKFSVIAFVEILRSCFNLGIVLLVLEYTGNRLRFYAVLITLVASIPPLLYFLYVRIKYTGLVKWNFQRKKDRYSEILGFSGWTMLGGIASIGEVQGSALLINLFFGTILNASFGIANQVNSVVKMFSQSLNQAAVPQITKNYSGSNLEKTLQLVIFSSKYSFFLLLIPALPILLETDFILGLWLKEVPVYTRIFIQLMVINALITTMTAGIPAAVAATGNIKYFQIALSILSLLGLPAAFVLFKIGSPAYVLLFVYTVISVLNFFVMQILLKRIIHFDIKLFIKEAYLKMVTVALAVSPLFFIIHLFKTTIFSFIAMTLLSVIWLLTAIYIFGMDMKEKEVAGRSIKRLVRRVITD